MERILQIYAALAAATALCLLGAALCMRLERRRRPWREVREQRYLRIVVHALLSGDDRTPLFPAARNVRSRLLLAEVLAGVMTAAYGLDAELVRRIVADHELDDLLLRRASRSRGYRRACYLLLLSALPASGRTVRAVCRFDGDANRCVRFEALMIRLAADPSMSLRLIAEFPQPLTSFEIARIMALLRRGVLPVAYGPLVGSENRNLRALGLAIVRQFGIEQAEREVLRIVGDETVDLSREALFTLCGLRRPLARRAVVRRVAAMNRAERRALLRCMALEGYAPEALPRFFGADERPYYEALVSSYKRFLVCSPRNS